MLHFGSFGGNPVRWMYLLLGLGGAIVFYTGNLLWIEPRRKKQRDANLPEQKRSTRVLGSLTVGVSLGCVIGISATLATTKWLPGLVSNVPAWHEGIYYAAFLLAVAWAFLRGAARSAYELLYVAVVLTALIPVGSLAALAGIPGTWNHSSAGVPWTRPQLSLLPFSGNWRVDPGSARSSATRTVSWPSKGILPRAGHQEAEY